MPIERKVEREKMDRRTGRARWVPSEGEISQDINKIVIKARPEYTSIMTIALKRK
jgi:hypothetical protein